MTTLQKTEQTVYTGFAALERMITHKIIRNESCAQMVYFLENGELMGTGLSKGTTKKRERDISFFMENKFVDFVEPLKVGDYAKVVNAVGHHYAKLGDIKLGDIIKITKVDNSVVPFRGDTVSRKIEDMWFMANHLVPATEGEVLAAKQAVLKVGDYAKVIANTNRHHFEVGEIVKLEKESRKEDQKDNVFRAHYLDGHDFWYVRHTDIEPLTAEEVEELKRKEEEEKKAKAEREKWAAMGRKVGEFRKGDIVRVTENFAAERVQVGDIVEVLRCHRLGALIAKKFRYALSGDIVVPVEKRFDK